jgi:hypothetical protein
MLPLSAFPNVMMSGQHGLTTHRAPSLARPTSAMAGWLRLNLHCRSGQAPSDPFSVLSVGDVAYGLATRDGHIVNRVTKSTTHADPYALITGRSRYAHADRFSAGATSSAQVLVLVEDRARPPGGSALSRQVALWEP